MTSAARHRAAAGAVPQASSALADLVLPGSCGGCAVAGTRWCSGCAGLLAAEPTCRVLPGGLRVWSAVPYEGPVRSAIVRWKDRGRADLTRPLATGLRRAATTALCEVAAPPGTALVPIPSSRRSRRARGHDPVRDLARASAAVLARRGRPVGVLPVLHHARPVADQAGLAADERRRNLAGALDVRPGWRRRLDGRSLLLVDDVVTTGATLAEARRTLAEAGAHVLAAATVACTPSAAAGRR